MSITGGVASPTGVSPKTTVTSNVSNAPIPPILYTLQDTVVVPTGK